jgi:hypothetical protein
MPDCDIILDYALSRRRNGLDNSDMEKVRNRSSLMSWYAKHSSWAGWLGIALVAGTFLAKEVMLERFKEEKDKVHEALRSIDEGEVEKRQAVNSSQFGFDKADSDVSLLTQLESTEKLCGNDGSYIAVINRLESTNSLSESKYLEDRSLNETMLVGATKAIWSQAVSLTVNLNQEQRGKYTLPAAEKSSKSDLILREEGKLGELIDGWAQDQREALERKDKRIEASEAAASAATYVLFGLGWLITVADKLIGKGSEPPEV